MDDGILRFPKVRGLPVGRLAPAPMSGTDGGYPWVDGELLYAADLNAAVADAANIVSVLNHGAKGDGSTDDTAAIQNALNAYAGKATVLVPNTGQPYMCRPLVPQNGTDMLIYGTLKLLPASPNALIVVNAGTSRVTLRGNGVLDGNGAAQTTPMTIGNVYLNQSSNIRISGLTIQNANAWNLNVVNCSNVVVDGVTMLRGVTANEFASGCDDCWLTNCTIDGPDADIGFSFYGGVTNSGAIGNVIRNSGVVGTQTAAGITALADASQPAPCKSLIIADNIIYNSEGAGITVDNGTGASGLHEGIIVSNNRCYGNGRSNLPVADIGVNHCNDVMVTGNQSFGIGNGTAVQYAYWAGGNATGVSFIGNQAYSVGEGGTAGVGLYVASANILVASGNSFYDNQGTPTMANSIGGTAGLRNAYLGNYCDRPNAIAYQPDTVVEHINTGVIKFGSTALPTNAANDAAAASAGVPVGGLYRNGSVMMVRVV